ncbi:hypothetical protein [Bacteroides thetaiotaomicron]|uniref:hypothetical protein n=1 Tax=Bacteroides thetaiotaomicron TaxID=818 RepID=UPI002165F98C|nr:hypothetical protein [Bacteroides thetaiotaomicron]MCS2521000.1 hypothetical protein [Bacteroides thetaiotaomicron]
MAESTFATFIIIIGIVQLIMMIVFFVMAHNISVIKKRIAPSGEEFKSRFYSFLLSGNKEKAKELLFEVISKNEYFISSACYHTEYNISKAQNEINTIYKCELEALGIDSVDLSMLKKKYQMIFSEH